MNYFSATATMMIKTAKKSPHAKFTRKFSLCLAVCGIALAPLHAQEAAPDAPVPHPGSRSMSALQGMGTPPPPPNFTPPPPPTTLPPEVRARMEAMRRNNSAPAEAQTENVDESRVLAPAQVTNTAPEPLAPVTNIQYGPNFTDTQGGPENRTPMVEARPNPNMDETVGLIRLPELGTNEILEMLENFTGKPILRQQSLPAVKITFYSQGPMTRGEAILAIESLLSINGIAITPVGTNFLKAVPAAMINTQVPPLWEGSTLGATPSQQIYSKLFKLNFLSPVESLALVQPLMSQGAPLLYEKSGTLMITDSLINLQRIETVLSKVDRRSELSSKMLFFNLRNINAADVVTRLQALQQGALKPQLEFNTTFDADERSNQLLVFTHPDNEQFIRDLINQMDVDVDPLTRTEVYYVKYADATEVSALIQEVITGQEQARSGTGGRPNQPARPQRPAPAGGATSETKSLQFSNYFNVVPDERANTIIASGTENDHRYVEELITKIDSLLPQVRIEAIITEVRLSKNVRRGLDAFRYAYNRSSFGTTDTDGNTDNSGVVVGNGNSLLTPNIPGLQFGTPLVFGPGRFSLDLLVQQAQARNDVQVLSAPTIVTTHNREANILVGERRPFLTSAVDNSTTSDNRFTTNYQYQEVGIELKVKPLIGKDGVVQLEIDQKVDNVAPESQGNLENPVVTTRKATSFVSVGSGQIVVLGGLQSLDTSKGKSKMAIIGDIPLIGDLLAGRTKSEVRNELLIFIRPTVLANAEEAFADAKAQIDRQESREKIENYINTGTFVPPPPPPTEEEIKNAPNRRYPGQPKEEAF